MNKISETLKDVIQKAKPNVGDTKVGKDGITRKYVEYSPGKFDWRKIKDDDEKKSASKTTTSVDPSKFAAVIKKTESSKLSNMAKNPKNAPKVRQAAYDELVERGEDVSEIDLDTGRYGMMKQAFGVDQDGDDFKLSDGGVSFDSEDDEDIDWGDPDFIKKEFGGLKTKKQRVEYDKFVTQQKQKDPRYKTPIQEVHQLNKLYAEFIDTDAPLMIASGGAGVGKTFNFHLVAEAFGKKPFNPEYDTPGDSDYDYYEAPEVTPAQLIPLLKEHNGKIILFDDSDAILKDPGALGILKKATATSGKRMVGRQTSSDATTILPFEFTGKIIFLTNMSQSALTKNDDMKAISSRALKKDIYFTKEEQLFFIEKLKHKFEFTGVPRLENKAEDIQEREEVFQILSDNFENIDPLKFNSRSMKEAIQMKRANDRANEKIKNDPVMGKMLFGDNADWKEEVVDFLVKGYTAKEQKIEKAKEILHLS